MGLIKPKRKLIIDESIWGVCLWKTPSGGYISDGEGYLSLEGVLNSSIVEKKMREAAKYWTGSSDGEPVWFSGYRKVTNSEYDDQMERLLDGKIPDIADEARQVGG